jgi:hypothetical protein
MRRVGLLDAFDYCTLLASEAPERFDRAARPWLSLLLTECEEKLTLDDVQLALARLRSLPKGDVDQLRSMLRAMLKRRHSLHGQSPMSRAGCFSQPQGACSPLHPLSRHERGARRDEIGSLRR